MSESVKPAKDMTRPVEKVSFTAYFFGQGLIFALVGSTYLTMFLTDYVKLDPFVITVLLAVCKAWDAINDTLFGMIVDRVRFKNGDKFKPWLWIASFVVPLSTVLLFAANSSMDMTLRIVWVVLAYVIWDSAYTMCDAPAFALVTSLTGDVKERVRITTFGSMGGALAIGVFNLVLVQLFDKLGFFAVSAIIAPISLLTMMLICIFGKERVKDVPVSPSEKPASFKETFRYLKSNKYLLFFYLYRFVSGCLYIAFTPYITKKVFGSMDYVAYITLISVPFILAVYIFAGKLNARFDKIVIYRFCMISTMVLQILLLLFGRLNVWIYVSGSALTLAFNILPAIFMTAIPGDCVEYGTYKSGYRKEGVTFALQTFTSKIVSAVAMAFGSLILGFLGYNGELDVQPPAVVDGIWLWGMLIPVISQVISIPLMFLYKLRDKDAQLMADCNEGKITREECEARLSRQYK